MKQTITILGSTGSIGQNTLNVIAQYPDLFEVFALSAYQQADVLLEQIKQFHPKYAVLVEPSKAKILVEKVQKLGLKTEILTDAKSLIDIACDDSVDTVMAAIVGSSGLKPTYEAVKKGKRILLANKETLVASGALFMAAAYQSKAQIIPVDSEHNAIFQCLPEGKKVFASETMHEIILTASGGPFRTKPLAELDCVTQDEALNHPNWRMGAKISIDSATMVNKALEMIEAYWLFNVPSEHLKVMIHPQSIIHSMVHYKDGSYLAQIGSPDMQIPIANALFYPNRYHVNVKPLNLFDHALTFEPVDYQRFPSIKLVYDLFSSSDFPFYSIVFNAVNEQLVADFLNGKIRFTDIVFGVQKALDELKPSKVSQVDDVFLIDAYVRQWVQNKNFYLDSVQ